MSSYNDTSFGGLLGLGARYMAAPVCLGSTMLDDAVDTRYRFQIYAIRDKVCGINAVYAFASSTRSGLFIKYIGKADILSERLASHDRIDEAVKGGANRLLVHIPAPSDRISHEEAEKRLIRRYSPPMNKQHLPSYDFSRIFVGLGIK